MKKIGKLAILGLSLTLAFGFSAFTACKDNNEESSSVSSSVSEESSTPATQTGYKFTVLNADGTPAANRMILLCQDENCFQPVTTDANGIAVYKVNQGAGVYDIHVLNEADPSAYDEFDGPATTPAEYGEITLTLK